MSFAADTEKKFFFSLAKELEIGIESPSGGGGVKNTLLLTVKICGLCALGHSAGQINSVNQEIIFFSIAVFYYVLTFYSPARSIGPHRSAIAAGSTPPLPPANPDVIGGCFGSAESAEITLTLFF